MKGGNKQERIVDSRGQVIEATKAVLSRMSGSGGREKRKAARKRVWVLSLGIVGLQSCRRKLCTKAKYQRAKYLSTQCAFSASYVL